MQGAATNESSASKLFRFHMFYRRSVVLVNDGLSTKEFGVIAQVVARLLFFQRLREFITYLDMNPCPAERHARQAEFQLLFHSAAASSIRECGGRADRGARQAVVARNRCRIQLIEQAARSEI